MRLKALIPLAAASFAVAVPAGADMFKPGAADQVKLGKRAADEIRKQEKVLPSGDQRVQIMRRVADRLLATVPEQERRSKPWEYSFDIIQNKDVNAFALPGGPVFFFTGLFSKFKTEDQLAGVLAHELTHIRKEHWASAYADSQKRQLGITALLLIFRANRTVFNAAGIANSLLFELPFSRRHETESDTVGFDMMTAAGYNPQGMADVFRILQQASSGGRPPEFLSTHPAEKNRINRIEDRIKRDRRSFPTQRRLTANMAMSLSFAAPII